MPVTGYVLRLDRERAGNVLEALDALAGVEVGEATAGGWPVVTETRTLGESKGLEQQIGELPGVLSLTPVYHNFEDEPKARENHET